MKWIQRSALVLALYIPFFDLQGQQAQIVSAVINGCNTNDGLSEYMVLYTGGNAMTDVLASDIDIRYATSLAGLTASTSITDSFVASGTSISATDLNDQLSGGCDFSFSAVTLGTTDIPAGSHILILNDGAAVARDFSAWCGQNLGTVYVMFSNDATWPDAGIFDDNPGTGDANRRFIQSSITNDGGTTTDVFTYNSQWASNIDGNYAQWDNASEAAAIYSNYSGCSPTETNALPVTLLHFDAKAMTDYVKVSWSTAEELNNSHFTLYRSTDGMDWRELVMIEGQGTTDLIQQYQYEDRAPIQGRSYYRLMQTDFGGTFETFEAVSVYFDGSQTALKVYPNPAGNFVNINCSEEIRYISLIKSDGQAYKFTNLSEDGMKGYFDISVLPTGVYQVLIYASETVFRHKLIKH